MPAPFDTFFQAATGNTPYDYQHRLAGGEPSQISNLSSAMREGTPCASRLISIPTGLGKTAAVILAQLRRKLSTSTAIYFFIAALRQHMRALDQIQPT